MSGCKHQECVTTNTPNTWIEGSVLHSYLAGLTDAEGCISGYFDGKSGGVSRQLNVANNVKSIVDFIHSKYKGFIQIAKHEKKVHKTSYRVWISTKNSQLQFLNHILPYLKLKKTQAELMLEWIKIEGRNKVARQEVCYKIQSLNHLKIESDLMGDYESGPRVISEVA